eukprot:CAMPEP_0119004950 /NCGR_PEP_ID=MMETSP1176-20130426/1447_1 /TAXON_ID=265551 /ORGANISM="Synedropsis recta cf, Strain CCMP1620" /LENGTH=59 /DNA_ID=CAMNT_0006956711 /DNA_START=46 /DNA_END=225 /DNA_ORIENTATION=+
MPIYSVQFTNILNPFWLLKDFEFHPNVGGFEGFNSAVLAVVSHNDQFSLWKEGELASDG